MRRLVYLLIALTAIVAVLPVDGRRRSSSEVRRERQQNRQRIEQADRELRNNSEQVGRQLNRLQSLEAVISLRADSIKDLQGVIARVTATADSLTDSIARLETIDASLRSGYADALRTMRSRRQSLSDVAFIFAANSFSNAWQRMRYVGDLSRSMQRRAVRIARSREQLTATCASLDSLRDSLNRSLNTLHNSQNAIAAERSAASTLVNKLQRRGRELTREIDRRRRQAEELERELQQAIDRELAEQRRREEEERRRREAEERQRREAEERQRREAEERQRQQQQQQQQPAPTPAPTPSPAPAPAPSYASEAAEMQRLTGDFAANKGKLPFPVAGRYTIISNFGTNTHPDLAKVKIDNLGIDIQVPPGTSARAVFDGVISSVFRLDGYNNVVIVRHGEYLTVYAGLDALAVRKGDKVRAGQNIGTIVVDHDDDDRTVLHFEVRREKQKLNPTEWVK